MIFSGKKEKKPGITFILRAFFAVALCCVPTLSFAAKPLEKLFYYVPGEGAFITLDQYVQNIDVFAPQVYKVDATGTLTGKISDKAAASVAKNPKAKVMPLVFQEGFDPAVMHAILSSVEVQNRIADQLVAEAQSKGYAGWQFDFEHIMATDRDAYSSFVELVAKKLHEHNASRLILSVAVIARTSEKPSDLPEGSWDNWAGVFDYSRIGKAADFVTLMAYDMPASKGPVASIAWVKKTLAYLEKFVPGSKISLGVATYGWLWNTDTNKRVKSTGYDRVLELVVNKLYDKKGFDAASQSAWITYTDRSGSKPVHYKLWYQDVRSFRAAYSLAKSHKLRGISVWVIGMEDGEIWKNLK